MNNIIRVMVEETVARKLSYVLKEEQRKVINAFVQGNDVFAVLSTGYGKFFCYERLLFFFRYDGLSSIVIVVTSLTAITKDQVVHTLFALSLFSYTLDHLRQPAPPANIKTVTVQVLTLRHLQGSGHA